MMANKQIIIDCSDCEHLDEKQCYGGYKYKWCKDNEDCHYRKAEYYRQALKDIEEIINTPPDDTRLGKIIMRLAEVEY